jgi:hypothetical protein
MNDSKQYRDFTNTLNQNDLKNSEGLGLEPQAVLQALRFPQIAQLILWHPNYFLTLDTVITLPYPE